MKNNLYAVRANPTQRSSALSRKKSVISCSVTYEVRKFLDLQIAGITDLVCSPVQQSSLERVVDAGVT